MTLALALRLDFDLGDGDVDAPDGPGEEDLEREGRGDEIGEGTVVQLWSQKEHAQIRDLPDLGLVVGFSSSSDSIILLFLVLWMPKRKKSMCR